MSAPLMKGSMEISLGAEARNSGSPMSAGLEKPELRQFSPERGVIVSRRYLELSSGAAFTIHSTNCRTWSTVLCGFAQLC